MAFLKRFKTMLSVIFFLAKAAIILFIILIIAGSIISFSDYIKNKKTPNNHAQTINKTKNCKKENQEYYESVVSRSSYNFNDWFNISPGQSNLGDYGEFLTFKEIVKLSGHFNCYYKILRNIHVGVHCEIDLVWIHTTGIYVFESKNISGWIFGNENDKQWCKVLNGQTKKQFYNPIKQNNGHIHELKRILGNSYPYYSIIVFSERCELKEIPADTDSRIITKRNNLRFKLENKLSIEDRVLSIAQIEALYQKLLQYSYASDDIIQKHNEYVNNKYGDNRTDRKSYNNDNVDLPF